MVTAAAESLRRNGVAGTSFTEVLADSGAARGAIYHHFPGGKTELVEDAVAMTGARVTEALSALPPVDSEAEVIDAFLDLVRPVVLESATGAGCAVAAVVNETRPGDSLQTSSSEALDSWHASLAAHLRRVGAARRRADQIATLLLTTLEGAHVLCRAAGDIEPFDRAAAALQRL